MGHLIGSNIDISVVDKRRTGPNSRPSTHLTTKYTIFTANAGGSTSTLVGANAAPGTNDVNTVRRGDKFRLFAAGAALPKEETIFTVINIAVAASTTLTFSPAALVATVSTDLAKLVGLDDIMDELDLDAALGTMGYNGAQINSMNQNDKIYAYRLGADKDGI